MENNNGAENGIENGKNNEEDDNLYSNPYASLNFNEGNDNNELKNGDNLDKNDNNVAEKNENNKNFDKELKSNEKNEENNNKNTDGENKNNNKNENINNLNINGENRNNSDDKDDKNNTENKKEKNINKDNDNKNENIEENNNKVDKIINNNKINDNNMSDKKSIIKEEKNINNNNNNNLKDKNSNNSKQNNNTNNKNVNNSASKSEEKRKPIYTIKETGSHLYIENTKKISLIAIEKSFDKIYTVEDFSEILNLNPMKTYNVNSILGIIDINGNNKYLLIVSSSKVVANIMGADIYNILDVDLIQITLFNESENEQNRKNGVKKLFQSKNFYYSNELDLSNNIFDKSKKNIINDYCVNTSLLKYFFNNLISNDFYSKIIYGYVGFKKNIEISNNNNSMIYMDNLIIERVNKHLNFNTDITNQMKQIEFICIYKSKIFNKDNNNNNKSNNNNKYNTNGFSFIFYISSEIANTKVAFNPLNNFIMNELSRYQNIICIINNNVNVDLNNNININNNKISNIVCNSNSFGQKIKLLNFTSDWKKNLYFDTNNNSNIYIKSGVINTNTLQGYIFWFIDINNMFNENDCCFNAIIRIMWKAIQQQIDSLNFKVNIGQFNKNNSGVVCNKFKDIIMNYHNDLDMNKKPLYKSQMRKQLQKVFDYYFNRNNIVNNNNKGKNVYDNYNNQNNINNRSNNSNRNNNNFDDKNLFNKNNFNAYQNVNTNMNNNYNNNQNQHQYQHQQQQQSLYQSHNYSIRNNNNNSNFDNQNSYNNFPSNMNQNMYNNIPREKLTILCITWNVGGIPSDHNYNIKDLLTQNIFYKNYKSPDIIVIGLQEIVELDIINVLNINTNEENVNDWTKNINSTIDHLFPYTYKLSAILHLIGLYCICFTKSQLKHKIKIVDTNVIKTGLFGTLGNKGYITLSIKYNNKIFISFAISHFEAGTNSNEERIDTLKQILNTKNEYNGERFRKADFYFVLGDLNFRIDTSFEEAINLISYKDYKKLIKYDQFYSSWKRDGDLSIIREGEINFPPTYKYEQGTNNFVGDSENTRIPSWTDRILFSNKKNIRNLNYSYIPSLMYSDHRPVQAAFEIDIDNYNINSNQNNNNSNMNNYNNINYNNFNNNSNFNKNNFNNSLNNNFNNNFSNQNNNFNNNFTGNNYNRNNQNFNDNNRNNNYNNGNINNNQNYHNNNNNYRHNNNINQNNVYKSTMINQNYNRNNTNKNNNMSQSSINSFQNNNYNNNQINMNNNGISSNNNQNNNNESRNGNNNNNNNSNNNNNDDDFDNIDNIQKFFK